MDKHGLCTQLDDHSIDIRERRGRKLPSDAMEHGAGTGQQLGNEDALLKVRLVQVVRIAPHGPFRGPSLLCQLSTKGALSVPKLSTRVYIRRPAAEFALKAQSCSLSSRCRRFPRPAPVKPSNNVCAYPCGVCGSVASVHCYEAKSEEMTVRNGHMRSANPPAVRRHTPHRHQAHRPQSRPYCDSRDNRNK